MSLISHAHTWSWCLAYAENRNKTLTFLEREQLARKWLNMPPISSLEENNPIFFDNLQHQQPCRVGNCPLAELALSFNNRAPAQICCNNHRKSCNDHLKPACDTCALLCEADDQRTQADRVPNDVSSAGCLQVKINVHKLIYRYIFNYIYIGIYIYIYTYK